MDPETAANLTYLISPADGCLLQGEIISDLIEPLVSTQWASPESSESELQMVAHPFAVVLTQSCDLMWDYEGRQRGRVNAQLASILFVAAETADALKANLPPGSDIWKRVRQNADERYMVLRAVPHELDRNDQGIPELGLDFKRYFTLPATVVYEQLRQRASRRSALTGLYASHLSMRFFAFQGRIGLPVDHHWQPQTMPARVTV